jgi:hypothetical protein
MIAGFPVAGVVGDEEGEGGEAAGAAGGAAGGEEEEEGEDVGEEGGEGVGEEGDEGGEAGGEEGGAESVEAAITVYVQAGDTLTCPLLDAPATRTVTVPLAGAGTVYVFELVLS